jgi:hypothetical protein
VGREYQPDGSQAEVTPVVGTLERRDRSTGYGNTVRSSRLRMTVAAQQPGAMNHRIGRTLHHNNHNVCQ